ncbi:MAG TPA: carbon starvation CstA 5TM domain-containing protein, partial [Gemmatimonadaceae bacterium]|nr:carbon starvation CstA 5TM domain-containing protein [Gemmatimonadaceae bacterium]
QLLAAVALCVGTTVIMKMGKARWAWVTLLPLAWLVVVTTTAGWAKLFSPDPRLGFLAHARALRATVEAGRLPAGAATPLEAARLIFNDYLVAAVAAFFLLSVLVVLGASVHEWWRVLKGRAPMTSGDVPLHPAVAGD